jgi:serine/threonine-protein kinase RsbW
MADHHLVLQPDIAEMPRLLDWIEASCAEGGVAVDIALKLALAIEEAVANTVNHGFRDAVPPHRLEVRLDIASRRLVAEIIDNGTPFDPTTAAPPDTELPLAQRDPGGLGIMLIHKMMDRVDYRRTAGENRLRLEKTLA